MGWIRQGGGGKEGGNVGGKQEISSIWLQDTAEYFGIVQRVLRKFEHDFK